MENDPKNSNLGTVLEEAIKEATDDETFRKVKRMSYSANAAEEVSIFCANIFILENNAFDKVLSDVFI